jgi:hypothetical protein
MSIKVFKNQAFCVRCGLKLKFRWWHSRDKQLREFTAIHDTLVRLRFEAHSNNDAVLNGCGMIMGKRAKGKKK